MELRRPIRRTGFPVPTGLKFVRLPRAVPDRWAGLSLPLRIFLIVAGGLFLGFAAALSGFGGHTESPVAAATTCSQDGSGAVTVTLGTGTTILSVSPSPSDLLSFQTSATGLPTSCGNLPVTSIAFSATGVSGDTVEFNQSKNAFPCINIKGTVGTGSGAVVEVLAAAPTTGNANLGNVTVGTSTLDLAGCGATELNNGPLAGVASYTLVANGADTLSAAGEATPADPATVPVTFQAGRTSTPGTETFDSSAAGSTTLDFSQVDTQPGSTCPSAPLPCSLVINSSGAATSTGLASFNAQLTETPNASSPTAQTTYDFSNGGAGVATFVGLSGGPTTFDGESGSYTLTGLQPGSQVVAGAGTETYAVTASNTTFTSGAASDTFTVTGNGNTFQADDGPDTFYDTLPSGSTAQPANTVDFSNVMTSSGPLSVNASGASQPITVPGSACTPPSLANGAAALGCAAANWTFLNGAGSNSASNFSTIVGAAGGSTTFLAGGSGGLTLSGQGSGNSTQFFGTTGVVANLSGGPETTSAPIGPSTTLSNFSLGPGQVLVSPPGSATSCTGTAGADCDTLSGPAGSIAGLTGPTSGFSTFYAGPGPGTYTFGDNGNNNTFIGGSGPVVFSSAGNNNTFVAGSGTATFNESTAVQGANNTINFSNVPTGAAAACDAAPCFLTVNVSGSLTAVSDFQAAVTDNDDNTVATYNFGNGGADFTTLIGAAGGNTTFDGGLGSYTYTGQGAGNTLDFGAVSSGITPLTFDVTHAPLPLATLDNVPETFSGITHLVGLPAPQGNTTFVGGANGGYTFNGHGTTNQATFTSEGASTTLSVTGLPTVNGAGTVLTGGTVTFTLPAGPVICPSVPVVGGGASCSTSSLPAPASSTAPDQVLAIYNPPAGSEMSGTAFILTATGTGPTAPPQSSVTSVEINNAAPGSKVPDLSSLLSATVNMPKGTTAIPSGTLTFSLAGGQTLCTAPVAAKTATTSEQASCNASVPPGTFNLLAVYAPSTNAVSASVATSAANQVTFSPSETRSTTTGVTYTASSSYVPPPAGSSSGSGGVSCDGSVTASFFDCAAATILTPGATGITGTVAFTEADGTPLCTVKNYTVGTSPTPATCSPLNDGHVAVPTGTEIVATFTPATPGAVSASAGVSAATTVKAPFLTTLTSTETSLSISPGTAPAPPSVLESVTAGDQETLTANVSTSQSSLLAGGQVVFGVAGGPVLCSAPVPGGTPPVTVQCQASIPSGDYQDLTAAYVPAAGSGFGASAADQPLNVVAATASTGTQQPVLANTNPGVTVNLGAAPYTTPPSSPPTTRDPIPGVTVTSDQVLVAEPPQGLTSCAVPLPTSPLPSFCDSITNAATVMGSNQGGNMFVAGSSSEKFGDTGSSGGDSIDFAGLSTGAGSALAVNVAGPALGSLGNFTAALGTTATYDFSAGGSNFTSFTGSSSGNTTFYGGNTGGYSFTGTGSGNVVDFSQTTSNPAVKVDLSAGPGSPGVAGGIISNFANGQTDTTFGLTSVIGSPGGGNTFIGGPTPAGPNPPPYTFMAGGSGNKVTVGTGSATFTDTAASANTMDFSGLAINDPVTVNASLAQDGSTQVGQATGTLGSVYTFGTSATTFTGAPGGTTFDAGGGQDTFTGSPGAPNTLSFLPDTSATVGLKVCVTSGCPSEPTGEGEALLGSQPSFFKNITTYEGLPTGNTAFVAGPPSGTTGSTFDATAGTPNNSIDFSTAAQGVTVNLGATPYTTPPASPPTTQDPFPGFTVAAGQVLVAAPQPPTMGAATATSCAGTQLPSFCDVISNLTTVTGSNKGGNTFVAGSSSENFGDTGSTGGDSIDFAGLSTNSGSALAVNVAGPAVGSLQDFTAALGTTATYNFATGGSGFTSFTGSSSGNTTFYAGSTGGYSFTGSGSGSGDVVDFSQTTSNPAVTVDLSKGSAVPGTVMGFAKNGPDTLSGLTSVIGSPGGGNTFIGGPTPSGPNPQPYTFMAGGSGNLVTVGTGSVTFADTAASANTMDFSQLDATTDPVTVNASLAQDGSTKVGQATAALGGVYSFGTSATIFKGSPAGTTFDAGGGEDTFNGSPGAPNTLSFLPDTSATVSLKVCVTSGCPSEPSGVGEALLGSQPSFFTNITTYHALPTGNTAFVAGPANGSTFDATAGTPNDSIDFSTAVQGVTVNLGATSYTTPAASVPTAEDPFPGFTVAAGQVLGAAPQPPTMGAATATSCAGTQLPSFCDAISNVTTVTGSSKGGNMFVAGSSSENFGDTGSTGGDSIDFAGLSTGAGSALAVNVAGPALGSLQDFTAALGTTATYNFATGGGGFTNFTGSSSGNTTFYAGSTGGYSFTGSGSGNVVDFSQSTSNPAVTVDLSKGSAVPGAVTGLANGPDTLTGLTSVIGSPGGGNTFIGGPTPSGLNPQPYTFMAGGSGNLVTVGTGSVTFADTAASANTMDFSHLPATDPVTVNASLAQDGSTQVGKATGGQGGVYSFGTAATVFTGSPGGATFDAGGGEDTFNGIAGTSNTLSFLPDTSATVGLQVCVVSGCPSEPSGVGEALLGSQPSFFTNITTYHALPTGNTAFVAGPPTGNIGSTFDATAGTPNNSIDFSTAAQGVTVNLGATPYTTPAASPPTTQDPFPGFTVAAGQVLVAAPQPPTMGAATPTSCAGATLPSFCDAISNLTTVTGSNKGDNTFVAGSSSENLGDTGSTGGDSIDFAGLSTNSGSALAVNVAGQAVGSLGNYTATLGATATYNFTTGGSDFTSFTGSSGGNTHFDAGATGGYTFTGLSSNNSVDFTTDPAGVVANLQAVPKTVCVTAGACSASSTDAISGITTITGSQTGDNTFEGALTGATFKSASPSNTVSYAGYTTSGLCFNLVSDQVVSPPATWQAGLPCTASSSSDTFSFPNGTPTVEGTPQADTFQVGPAGAAIEGGGGDDTLDLSQIPAPASGATGATVDLNAGSVTLPGVPGSGGTTFPPSASCGTPATSTDLCVTTLVGSKYNDSFTANANALTGFPALFIQGGTGSDSLSLGDVKSAATINMPITSGTPPSGAKTCSNATPGATGVVCATAAGANNITFQNINNVTGTSVGKDTFFAGSGTETLTENGTPGTLDYSAVPLPAGSTQGITVEAEATTPSGGPGGTVISPQNIGVTDTFTDMGTFNGTAYNDMFSQDGPGNYNFNGEQGSNTLDLSLAPAGTQVSLGPPTGPNCTTGINNNNGSAQGSGIIDTFSCMATVLSSTSDYQVFPGETATVNGKGTGTLVLDCIDQCATDGAATGAGVTITMPPTATGNGSVTGDGYNFSFTGMQTVDGTPYNDLFIAGATSVTINGEGGDDGVSFAPETAGEVVNLSGSPYTVPAGPLAGTAVPAGTAMGGDGGTITLTGISNVRGTATGNDTIVGGPGSSTLAGGSGTDTFLPTGGNDVIEGGSGTSTLDLSLLTSYSTFNLGSAARQQLGTGDGTLAVVPGTVARVIASPSGSSLQAGPGNITLMGGAGNDWLAAGNAGTGTQTLIAGTGNDTLVGGVGSDIMKGGSGAVTFVPGQGGTDTLSTTPSSPGNTLSYSGAPAGAQVNLSSSSTRTGLSSGTATGGWGATVLNVNTAMIDKVVGSPEADTFFPGATPVTILGNGGNDLFEVSGSDNTLTAGTGSASTFLFNGAGSGNTINGGGNSTVSFAQAPTAVNVNLQSGLSFGGYDPGFQSLSGIKNVIGTKYPDTLIAGGPGETLTGGEAIGPCSPNPSCGDVLQVGPTGGDTLVSGGSGNDTFCADPICSNNMPVAGGNTMVGGSGDDTFFAQDGANTITGHAGDTAYTDPQDTVTGIPPTGINPP